MNEIQIDLTAKRQEGWVPLLLLFLQKGGIELVSLRTILSEEAMDDIAVIQAVDIHDEAMLAIEEGVTDPDVVNIAMDNASSIMYRMIDRLIAFIQSLAQTILILLNNYIVNNANLVKKYRNLLVEKYETVSEPIVIHTYTFPKLKDSAYPKQFSEVTSKVSDSAEKIQSMAVDLHQSPSDVAYEVDNSLMDCGDAIVGEYIDPYDIKASTEKAIKKNMLGDPIMRKITPDYLDTLFDEMMQYNSWKRDVQSTKKQCERDCAALKKEVMTAYKQKLEDNNLKQFTSPEMYRAQVAEYNRFNSYQIELNRFMNGIIEIYSAAYTMKLQIIQKKIEFNRDLISRLMVATDTFSLLKNGKKTITATSADFREVRLIL